jgi:acetate kinase
VVHGGERFRASCPIDDSVIRSVEETSALAPLHNPANLTGIRAARAALPDLPHVAVFDTAFHQTMPPHAYRYAVPEALYREHGVRRYGFHGTSYRFVVGEAASRLDRPLDDCALLVAHLGNGCSAAAVLNGRSVDTTMGLTPLEGLVMGTRSGDVDPGLFEHLERETGRDVHATTRLLNAESGLRGLSGLSNDMRTLLDAANRGHEGARLAIEVFVHRLSKSLAGLSVSLPRVDGLVFTGGIGENAARIRADTLTRLSLLGFFVDETANAAHGEGRGGRITRPDSVPALVVRTNEELMIARDTAAWIRRHDGEGRP